MQVQNIANQNNNLNIKGKGSLKKLTSPMIKLTSTRDSVVLSNKSNGIKMEIHTFPENEIKKLQDIAEKIYERKRFERSLSKTK